MCDGNVTSTAEYSIDFSDIKLEIDSSLSDDEQPELSPVPMNFVLGEAHSLLPEEFDGDHESDGESFHSAESAELDERSIETVEERNENSDQIAGANDEMEVTTTVQESGYDTMIT